jgi:hypothetical protein
MLVSGNIRPVAYILISTLILIANTSAESTLAIISIVAICLLNILVVRLMPRLISPFTLLLIYIILNFLFIAIILYISQQYGLNLTRREEIYSDLYETIGTDGWAILLPLTNEYFVSYYSFHNESVEVLRALGVFGGFAFFYFLFSKLKSVERGGGLALVLWILITSLVVSPLTTPYTSALVAMMIGFYKSQYFSNRRCKSSNQTIDANDVFQAR